MDHQVAIAGGWRTWATAGADGAVTVWGSTANHQLGSGTPPVSGISTPTVIDHDISPYRLPWRFTRGTRDATGNLSTLAVDKVGNARAARSGRGNETFSSMFDTYAGYDAAQRQTWSISAANRTGAKIASIEYDPFGNPVKRIDPRGNATATVYDRVNRPTFTTFTRHPDDAPDSCIGSASSSVYTPQQNGHRVCFSSTTYDGNNHEISSTDANSQVTKKSFDAAGRQVRVDTPRNHGGYATVSTRWLYDRDGNVLSECTPRQFATDEPEHTTGCVSSGVYSTHVTRDRAGRVSAQRQYRTGSGSPTTLTTSYGYDADGNTVSVTDPNSHTTSAAFDLQGRRTSMTVPRTGSINYTTRWSYDPAGNVTAVRAPGSLNIGSGADGNLTIDGTTAANSTDGVAHGAGNPFEIPDGAQYRTVTLQNGAHVTAADDHGLMFHATETVTVCATCVIDMGGTGYSGGDGGTSALGGNGDDAENPNTGAEPGNGGTGGGGNLLAAGAGGGGGGHKNAGSDGTGPTPGDGGLASGTSDFATVGTDYLRGAGGGGGGGGKGLLGTSGDGGDGGGYVRITATKIVIDGKVDASGGTGATATSGSGGGGGGAGGGIWLAAPTVNLASSTTSLDVSGGTGGDAPNDRDGGNGSVGRIRIDADTLTNEPAGADRSKAAMITAYSYDAANRVVDTIEGAQTLQADPAVDDGEFAVPDPHGLANTRSRMLYNADGQVSAMLPPQAFSNAASLEDPNIATARRVDYDLDGRPNAVYSPRYDNTVTSIGAGDDGGKGIDQQIEQCTTSRTPDAVDEIGGYPTGTGVCVTRTTYDANGNVSIRRLPTSSGTDDRYLSYTYTPDNLPKIVGGPDPDDDGHIDVAKNTFDAVGQKTSVTDADEQTDTFAYTSDRLLKKEETQSAGSVTHETNYTYDANGNRKTVTDPRGNVTTNTWTSDNLLASISAPGNGSGNNITTYGYDNVGNPTSVLMPQQQTKPDQAVRNQYTADNLLAATHTPVTASGGGSGSGVDTYRSVNYAHAPSGAKIATETAKCTSGTYTSCTPSSGDWDSAGVIRLTYGANGRVADQVGKTKSSITTTYAQHGGAKTISDPISDITITTGYYLDGLPRTVDDGQNENTYAYDAAGQVSVRTDDESTLTGGAPATTSYAYNQAGLVAAMDSGVLEAATSYKWHKDGLLDEEKTGGHVTAWDWYDDGTLKSLETTAGGSTKAKHAFVYDNNGDITSQTVTGAEPYENTYSYTPARNLASWTVDLDGLSQSTIDYGWDKNNNRTTITENNTLISTTSYRLDNSISSVNNTSDPDRDYTYDNAGLLSDDDCNDYDYDDFDRVASVHSTDSDECSDDERTTTYTYDGLDRQRTIAVNKAGGSSSPDWTTRTVYDGLSTAIAGQADAVNDDESTPNVLYQLDNTGRQIALKQSGAGSGKSFLDTDGHDNVTTQVTTGNAVVCSAIYDPFGNPIHSDDDPPSEVCESGDGDRELETGNTIWYRNQARDGSTGQYQLGTRTYDPSSGTFTTPDSYRISDANTDLSVGADPLTANTYSYVNGNPINLIDPSGHFPIPGPWQNWLNKQNKKALNWTAKMASAGAQTARQAWRDRPRSLGDVWNMRSTADLGIMSSFVWIGDAAVQAANLRGANIETLPSEKFNKWIPQEIRDTKTYKAANIAGHIGQAFIPFGAGGGVAKASTWAGRFAESLTTQAAKNGPKAVEGVGIAGRGTLPKGIAVPVIRRPVTGSPDPASGAIKTPEELADLAQQIKHAGNPHPAQLSQQVIAVGTNSEGLLVAASNSSSSWTAAQRTVLEKMGIQRAPSRQVNGEMLHAEENLLGLLPDATGVGTSRLAPCPSICGPLLDRFGIPSATAP